MMEKKVDCGLWIEKKVCGLVGGLFLWENGGAERRGVI